MVAIVGAADRGLQLGEGGPSFNDPFTLAGWLRVDALPPVFAHCASVNNAAGLVDCDGLLILSTGGVVSLSDNAGAQTLFFSPFAFATGRWYFVALVRVDVRNFAVYVDGVLVAVSDADVSARSAIGKVVSLGQSGVGSGSGTADGTQLRFWGWSTWSSALSESQQLTQRAATDGMPAVATGDVTNTWELTVDATATTGNDMSDTGTTAVTFDSVSLSPFECTAAHRTGPSAAAVGAVAVGCSGASRVSPRAAAVGAVAVSATASARTAPAAAASAAVAVGAAAAARTARAAAGAASVAVAAAGDARVQARSAAAGAVGVSSTAQHWLAPTAQSVANVGVAGSAAAIVSRAASAAAAVAVAASAAARTQSRASATAAAIGALSAAYVCIDGTRWTSTSDVIDVSVKAEADNGIDLVEFVVEVDGSPYSIASVTSRSYRYPNCSSGPSIVSSATNTLAPFEGYGVSLNLATVPAGVITVTATVHGLDGQTKTLETLTFYADTGVGDSRPTTAVVYVDGDAGSDTNNGSSWALAVQSIGRAHQLIGAELGGATIRCRGHIANLHRSLFPQNHTSGKHWCTYLAEPGTLLGEDPDVPGAGRTFSAGEAAGGIRSRHRFIGFQFWRGSCVCYVHGGDVELWIDGCDMEADTWSENRPTVLWGGAGCSGSFFDRDGILGTLTRYYTASEIRGAVLGFEAHRLLWDCRVNGFIGIALKWGSLAAPSVTGACVCKDQTYEPGVTPGFVRMDDDATQGQGIVPTLVVTKPTASTARITGPSGGYRFDLDAQELVGQGYWGLRFLGSGAANLDSTVAWEVTNTGLDGSAPWVEVTCPAAAAATITGSACTFWTAQTANGNDPGREYWYIHPDGIQIERTIVPGDMIVDTRFANCPDVQSIFTSGNDGDGLLLDNIADDGSGRAVFALSGSSLTNTILQRMTMAGQLQNPTGSGSWTGSVIRHCVFGSAGGGVETLESRGCRITSNHWIGGTPVGTDSTTGSWFAGDPTAPPFSAAPSTGNRGTASAELQDPDGWAWSSSAATKGALRNVAEIDWSTLTADVTANGAARVGPRAQGAGTVAIGAAAAAAVGPRSSGSASMPVGAAQGGAATQTRLSASATVSNPADVFASGAATTGTPRVVASATVSINASASPMVGVRSSTAASVAIVASGAAITQPRASTLAIPDGGSVSVVSRRLRLRSTTAWLRMRDDEQRLRIRPTSATLRVNMQTLHLTAVPLDIYVARNTTAPFDLVLVDAAGAALSIAGASFVLTVNTRENPDATGAAEQFQLTGTIVSGPDSRVRFAMTAGQADLAAGSYYYDVVMTSADLTERAIAKGRFVVHQNTTP